MSLGAFHGEVLFDWFGGGPAPTMSLVAVASDRGDGAFVLDARGILEVSASPYPLRHVDRDGTPIGGWNPDGVSPDLGGLPPSTDAGVDASLRVVATGDGGAMFIRSQVEGRDGVFAIRMGPAGQVLGVPPTPAPRAFRAWFARGAGVHVQADGAAAVRLTLHDLAGREVARSAFEAETAGEWTVPGTADLSSGVYFARAMIGGRMLHARVAVVR